MKGKSGIALLLLLLSCTAYAQKEIYLSTEGNDLNNGTITAPLRSFEKALEKAAEASEKEINIYFRAGTYRPEQPYLISSSGLSGKKLRISPWQQEKVIISGAKKLHLQWKKGKKGIYQAHTEDCFDQLWINGEIRVLARYPNFQENKLFNGTAKEALSPERIRKWENPVGGYIHSMHIGRWGSQHYLITGKVGDSVTFEGGYQLIRNSPLHPELRFVENIKEELDSPGEWFLDTKEQILYYLPLPGEVLETAEVEAAVLPHLFELRGESPEQCLKNVTLSGFYLCRTLRTFMHPYESLMRSDWGIYRGGAVILENTEECIVSNCEFNELGGNGIFVSRYNFNDTIRSNHIHHTAASGICLVGDTTALRSGAWGYYDFVPLDSMDRTPGPKNNLYPRQCAVEDNLIHDVGTLEKQIAGIQIQIAAWLTIRHNTIYRSPRAGINIGDGAFGGHLLEYNDVFETVLETSDHGSLNTWGRDRYWHPEYDVMNRQTQEHPDLILLDALYTTVVRNNRFRCDHGWDIDLDDGSSNYHIYNNLCLRGGIKLREGFFRKVENNILINSSLHPHLWFPHCRDIVQRNIFMQPYFPLQLNGWGERINHNFFSNRRALEKVRANGTDQNSMYGPLTFSNPEQGDFSIVQGGEPFRIGFENFPMNRFGVYSPELKAIAETPRFPKVQIIDELDETKEYEWLGARIRVVKGIGDQSAFGLPDERGVVITEVEPGSLIDQSGLRKNDVIRSINRTPISSVEEVYAFSEQNRWLGGMRVTIYRNQQETEKRVGLK